jgi:hypothetical protein
MTITVVNTDLRGTMCVIESKRVFTNIADARDHIKNSRRRKSGEEYFYAWDENGKFVQEVFPTYKN